MKKILIIGNGGREHALAWKCAQSENVEKVFVAPGNAGTSKEDKCENVEIDSRDIAKLLTFAKENKIDLTVVGPEVPLVNGIVDIFKEARQRIFGPSAKVAQLEGSKAFAKDFLKKHNIPTAKYEVFTELDETRKYLELQNMPIVIKADGLAAGKGVLVAQSIDEAVAFTTECLSGNKFGDAGGRVVIEEFMEGEEASFIVMTDGEHILPFATSQDHKLSGDGDTGQNTGGMGAYSPAPIVTEAIHKTVMEQIIKPTILGLKADGMPFTGFLYAGLMIDSQGNPKVVEYNVRLGDPETQPLLIRLQSDLVEIMDKAIDGNLGGVVADWSDNVALGVVMAAGGYPQSYEKGFEINGLESVKDIKNIKVFHAGTDLSDAKVVTNGGRVLCVTAIGDTMISAQSIAYEAVNKISWKDEKHRDDIGWRAL